MGMAWTEVRRRTYRDRSGEDRPDRQEEILNLDVARLAADGNLESGGISGGTIRGNTAVRTEGAYPRLVDPPK
jgi:hypothetical protein